MFSTVRTNNAEFVQTWLFVFILVGLLRVTSPNLLVMAMASLQAAFTKSIAIVIVIGPCNCH